MSKARSASDYLPARLSLTSLRQAAQVCRGCDLYKRATQVVFGEGPARARIMLIGEMPGDEEDRAGRPFVGAAGRLLDSALEEAGLARSDLYVTNAVKHFRWEERGKKRLHKKPRASEVQACHPWQHAELLVVHPNVVVLLGATAAQSLLGRGFRISRDRGKLIATELAPVVLATHHPAAVLRTPDAHDRRVKRAELIKDLTLAANRAGQ